MSSLRVTPSFSITGEVEVPGDKSISHRAIMLGALANGKCQVNNFLFGGDCLATLDCFRQLGIEVDIEKSGTVQVLGKGLMGLSAAKNPLDCVRSGTTMRLMAGLLSGQKFNSVLSGDLQLLRRPMNRVIEPLRKMGAKIESVDGHAPLEIIGRPLSGHCHELAMPSAQVKSALLLAGLYADGETTVISPGPSRDHTERMLSAMGADIRVDGAVVQLNPSASLEPFMMNVPGDFSSAAFIIAAGVLVEGAEIVIRNLGVNPTRTGFLDVLRQMGASVVQEEIYNEGREPVANLVVSSSTLKGVQISGDTVIRMIDEFPIMAVVASQAEGITRVTDAGELQVKETDRISTVVSELRKMGAKIDPLPDGFIIEGPTPLKGAIVSSHGDHRLAMALSVAGLVTREGLIIQQVECISDSFPGFIEIMQGLGAKYD